MGVVWEGSMGLPSNLGIPESPSQRVPETLIQAQEGLTADIVLHHLIPVLCPDLAPLARGVQVAGQDDHRR